MPSFAGCRLSADDVSTLHTQYHDAMHGTFASDKHYNLPRSLRSHLFNESRNASVLSTTPAPSATLPSAFHTPQWNEFSNYVQELSPPEIEPESTAEAPSNGEAPKVQEGTCKRGLRAGEAANKNVQDTSAEYDVVDRLDALSRIPNADPVAVAAALREAEDMLRHPTDTASSRSAARDAKEQPVHDYPHRSGVRAHKVRDESTAVNTERQRHADGRVGLVWESEEVNPHHRHHLQHHRRGDEVEQVPCTRSNSSTQALQAPAGTSRQPWPWPTDLTDPEMSTFPPYPTLSYPMKLPDFATQGLAVSPSFAGGADKKDATTHWYEAYYAWMLYYQQLYAARVMQHERQLRRAQRREARRHRSERRRQQGSDGSHVEGSTSAEQEEEAHYDVHGATDHHPQKRNHLGNLEAQPSVFKVDEKRCHRRHQCKLMAPLPQQRHHSRGSSKLQMVHDTTSGNSEKRGNRENKSRDCDTNTSESETHQLRAKLQQLEEKLAALSAIVANETEDLPSHEHRHYDKKANTVAGRAGNTHANAGGSRERSVNVRCSSNDAASAQPAKAKPTTEGTWRALTERQRSWSGANNERLSRASQQRPQWR